MKKGLIIATSATLAVLLSACGGQSNKHATTSSMHTIKTSQAAKPAKKTGVNVGWDGDKADQLRDYMADFGTTMQQKYDEVTAASDTNFMGVNLGQYIQDKKQVSIDGTTQAVKWLPGEHGGSKTKENILAVYADTSDNILYLFAKKGDTARVLVTQSAAQNGVFDVKETSNSDIRDAFNQIMAGTKVSKPAGSSNSTANSNTATASTSGQKNMDPKADGSAKPFFFPAVFQGTWYSEDNGTSEKITFNNNEMIDTDTTSFVYDGATRSAADTNAVTNPDQENQYKMNNWASGSTVHMNGNAGFNINGWYAGAGDGETFLMTPQNFNGQATPVITIGSGAGNWTGGHLYKSEQLAQQHKDAHYDSDISQ